MQTKSAFIYRSIEYLAWFLIFMLIESSANTRVGEVIGGEKVELFYGIFILCTAAGFLLFGAIGRMEIKSRLCGFYAMFLTIHFIRIASHEIKTASKLQFFIPGCGRVGRCVLTAMITFAMLILGNEISVQIMIFVSCVLAIILVMLLAVSDVLIVKENNRKIDESLAVPEKSDEIIGQEDFWSMFVDEYEFTDRECDVLEELIHTESNLQEISDKLFISKRVVQRHITSIYEKTSCSTRIGLLQLYVEFIRKKTREIE